MVKRQASDTDELIRIGNALRKIRLEKKLTLDDVLFDTGIHIGRIETATLNISVTTLKRLCDYYNISIVDFFNIYY